VEIVHAFYGAIPLSCRRRQANIFIAHVVYSIVQIAATAAKSYDPAPRSSSPEQRAVKGTFGPGWTQMG